MSNKLKFFARRSTVCTCSWGSAPEGGRRPSNRRRRAASTAWGGTVCRATSRSTPYQGRSATTMKTAASPLPWSTNWTDQVPPIPGRIGPCLFRWELGTLDSCLTGENLVWFFAPDIFRYGPPHLDGGCFMVTPAGGGKVLFPGICYWPRQDLGTWPPLLLEKISSMPSKAITIPLIPSKNMCSLDTLNFNFYPLNDITMHKQLNNR
jgi:hypothetical protein